MLICSQVSREIVHIQIPFTKVLMIKRRVAYFMLMIILDSSFLTNGITSLASQPLIAFKV